MLPISQFLLLAPVEQPCLSSHAHLCALWSATWSITALSHAHTELLVLLSRFSIVLLWSAPHLSLCIPSALSRSISSCMLPLFRARFRVRNIGGPLHLSPVNFYPPYSIVHSRVFWNMALVLFLLFVIELTRGLHICIIYYQKTRECCNCKTLHPKISCQRHMPVILGAPHYITILH